MDGIPRLLPEPPHHVVLADVEPLRQLVDGQRLCQVQVQVLQQGDHLAVSPGGAHPVPAPDNTVHLHHQLGELRLCQQRRTVAALPDRLRQRLKQRPDPAAVLVAVYILECLLRPSEALRGIAVPRRQRPQVFRRDVQDHPLVVVPRRHHRPVDAAAPHQHEVAGIQLIPFALHGIARLSRQQDNNLMKGVVVIFNVFAPSICQMEQAKRLLQVASLLILQRFHRITSAFFASIISQLVQILQYSSQLITVLKILFPICNFYVAFLIEL